MLKGKAAVVTGSTSGIELGIARALAKVRCNIMFNGFGEASAIERERGEIATEFGVKVAFNDADLSKPTVSLKDAVAMIPEGATLMIGGFMGVGSPERVIDELVRQGKRNLTVIANDDAIPGRGIGKLVDAGLVSKTIASHIGLNRETQRKMISKKMEVDLVPQGTLIERIRAGGYGLGGVRTPTGVDTVVEEGKQRIEVNGKSYLLETALRADFAPIHSFLADYLGNLAYALIARNFNPVMAMAADTTIVAADNIVPVGVIAPDHVVTPAPLIDYLVTNG
jgi:acetate CoA/acetoacetate CoA-transferase alpha subunit